MQRKPVHDGRSEWDRTVVQAPTVQAPTQAPTRNDTNPYLPHGQGDPALLLSDLHGDIDNEEEEEECNTGNTGNNEESISVPSPVFTPHRGQSHRGQLVVDTQATTPSNLSPIRGIDLSQDSNAVSDGEEGS